MNQLQTYIAQSDLPVSIEEAFAFHERPGALKRLVPPWDSVTIERSDDSLAVGSRVVLKTKVMGLCVRWVAEHTDYDPPTLFADRQVSGPFAKWQHHHEFESLDDGSGNSRLRDRIEYQLPFGSVGRFCGGRKVRQIIETMFAFRHQLTRDDLSLVARYQMSPLKVAVSGGSGLVGGELCAMLGLLGHDVRRLVRSRDGNDQNIAVWSSEQEAKKLEDLDAVVHLAGKSIASARWNHKVKQEIRDSRVLKTRQLCESLAKLQQKPRVLICASATGIYGDRGDQMLNEQSELGDDFLADVASQWEAACQPAVEAGIRVVHARFGVVLSPQGGALEKMLLPAKLAGGALGGGKQWWSWIALDDALGAIYHCIADERIRGPVNLVSPDPIQNRDFVKVLGRVLGRPAWFPAPAFALRTVLGEMADALLLSSTRVTPSILKETGYQYRFSSLESYLRYGLGKNRMGTVQ